MTCDWWDVVRPKCRKYEKGATEAPTTMTTMTTTTTTTKPKVTPLYVNWWLTKFDEDYKKKMNGLTKLSWASSTNVTDANRIKYQEAFAEFLPWMTEQRKQVCLILEK